MIEVGKIVVAVRDNNVDQALRVLKKKKVKVCFEMKNRRAFERHLSGVHAKLPSPLGVCGNLCANVWNVKDIRFVSHLSDLNQTTTSAVVVFLLQLCV